MCVCVYVCVCVNESVCNCAQIHADPGNPSSIFLTKLNINFEEH